MVVSSRNSPNNEIMSPAKYLYVEVDGIAEPRVLLRAHDG